MEHAKEQWNTKITQCVDLINSKTYLMQLYEQSDVALGNYVGTALVHCCDDIMNGG